MTGRKVRFAPGITGKRMFPTVIDIACGRSQSTRPAGRVDMRAFIRFPWSIYQGDPQWVPPLLLRERRLLNPAANPFFQHASIQPFVAFRDGCMVGRIAAIIDTRHNNYHGEAVGFFGFFECIDDGPVAEELLRAVAIWLGDHGMTVMRGPFNPSTSDSLGVLVEGFDCPPAILMAYNPPYYSRLIEASGLTKARDLYAYYLHSSESEISPKVERVAAMVRKRHRVSVRSANVRRIRDDLDLVKLVHNEASGSNWGFVPKTEEELDRIARDLRPLVDPDLAIFAFVDGEPAGFSLALPDWNQVFRNLDGRLFPFGLLRLLRDRSQINLLRVYTTGVRPQFRNLGLDAIFYYETWMRGVGKGLLGGEFSWVLEDNVSMRNTLENMGARRHKTYRIYERAL